MASSEVPKKDGCRSTGTIAGAAAGVSGLPTDASARSKAARDSRSLGNPVHWIPGMADQENGSCKWFRWGGEPHNHSTPAAHGPQSASPCGCHQGRHAPPDANWWDETRILCRRPSGLVGPRLTQVGGCLFPIGVRLKTRKLSELWAICEQQGPNPAGGSATTGGRALQEASAKDAESCRQG